MNDRCPQNLKGHRWTAWFLDFEDNDTEFRLCVDCGSKTHRARRELDESSMDVRPCRGRLATWCDVHKAYWPTNVDACENFGSVDDKTAGAQTREEPMRPMTLQQAHDEGYRVGKFQGGLPARGALEALYTIQRFASERPGDALVAKMREVARSAAQKLVAEGLGPENAPTGGYFPIDDHYRWKEGNDAQDDRMGDSASAVRPELGADTTAVLDPQGSASSMTVGAKAPTTSDDDASAEPKKLLCPRCGSDRVIWHIARSPAWKKCQHCGKQFMVRADGSVPPEPGDSAGASHFDAEHDESLPERYFRLRDRIADVIREQRAYDITDLELATFIAVAIASDDEATSGDR